MTSLVAHCQQPSTAVDLIPLTEAEFANWRDQQNQRVRKSLAACDFNAKPGQICLLHSDTGDLQTAVAGVKDLTDPFALGALPNLLPRGNYRLAIDTAPVQVTQLALGWLLGGYRFNRYRAADREPARLLVDTHCDLELALDIATAITCVRDLINTPAADMMPENLAAKVEDLARQHGARFHQTIGEELLSQNFPTIHAVGRASVHAPRLLELRWGQSGAPKITLVGKGVCFDSGGLDLKPASNMRLMKKDMGGAAQAIGLAELVMRRKLAVDLRLLIPAVENAVSGNSYRPGDIIKTRQGLSVEIDNTDAEGRLVLSDALALACEDQPDLLLDFATLTGAARVALGTDLPALFCNQDELATALLKAADEVRDPLWRLPLYSDYRELLDSKVADLANSSASPFAGSITAALFLQAFVKPDTPWAHLDLMAWNVKSKPGRPEGGEAMGLRAIFDYLQARYA